MQKQNKSQSIRMMKTLAIIILGILILFISNSLILNYYVSPTEIYKVDSENLIEEGGFENFNQSVYDCCNKNQNESNVFSSQTLDSYEGEFALQLTSYSQCACINKPLNNFNNKNDYLVSFYYKGDNPRVCGWTIGVNKCIPDKTLNKTSSWSEYNEMLFFLDNAESSSVFFYADSSGSPVTNLYDDLQVHRLVKMYNDEKFYEKEQYIIKTKSTNVVRDGEKISDDDANGEAYYLVTGKPEITLKFPYSEIILILVMIVIIVRLLLKNEETEVNILKQA